MGLFGNHSFTSTFIEIQEEPSVKAVPKSSL